MSYLPRKRTPSPPYLPLKGRDLMSAAHLALPLKGREHDVGTPGCAVRRQRGDLLPLQGGGWEGDGGNQQSANGDSR
jgi:hypothetical protein